MSLNDVARLVGILAAGGSFIYACLRVGAVAGSTRSQLANLTHGLTKLTNSLQAFADKADERLNQHGERIARLEALKRREAER